VKCLPSNSQSEFSWTDTKFCCYRHSLVNWSHELDWYDETRSWGGVFTIRTNILAVSEVLNRVVQTENSLAHVQQRTTTRSQLLSQLISTPHRYTVRANLSNISVVCFDSILCFVWQSKLTVYFDKCF